MPTLRRTLFVLPALALVAGGATGAVGAGGRTSPPRAVVRVDQVGYASRATKRAYLMSEEPEPRATFRVVDSRGHTVYRGHAGRSSGAWSSRYPHVYPLDFDRVHAAGSYRLVVAGPGTPTSPRLRIAPPRKLYSSPLANSLFFYEAERDGPNFIRSALRTAPGHLNDARAMTYLTPKANSNDGFNGDLKPLGVRINASGGWWDAGDYPKFVETTSYTVALMLLGVRDFPTELGAGSSRSDFTREAAFGTDFLLRMWNDRTRTLYYQVGVGEANSKLVGDHDIWRLPQADDRYGGKNPRFRYIRHRPVFRAGPPASRISPNLAGRDAAAFALCYQVFRVSRPSFARRCLLAGEHVFDLADTSPKGPLLTVFTHDFYPESSWQDDLELGAVELYRALAAGRRPSGLPHEQPRHYLRLAAHWAHAYIRSRYDDTDTLNLYDVSGVAHYELSRAIARARRTSGLQVTRAALLADLERQLAHAIGQAHRDPFGFGFTWAQWDTTSHGAGLALMASEVDQLAHSRRYASWSSRWLGNIFGANPWGVSLVVGDGTTFPDCMQHQVANLAGSLDGRRPLLRGAVVEGPNAHAASGMVSKMRRCPAGGGDRYRPFDGKAVFEDNVQSYSTVEPAIDLGASLPLALARQAAGRY